MMLHLDYGKKMEESGIIDELFMHEGAHVSLDGDHKNVSYLDYNKLYETVSIGLF